MSATPAELAGNQVKRLPWEARHEWESRVKFVEDQCVVYGMEKAINLSLVWSNMKFLGCSYPPKVEQKVAHYPVPDLSTLRARRRQTESTRPSSSQPKTVGKGKSLATSHLDDVREDGQKKGHDATDSGEAELPHSLFSESAIAAKVDALIAAVRKQTETETKTSTSSPSARGPGDLQAIPDVLQDIAKTVCLCDSCLGNREPSILQKMHTVFQRYRSHDKELDFSFESSPDGVRTLLINGVQFGRASGVKKVVAKNKIAREVMAALQRYQEAQGLGPCLKRAWKEREVGGAGGRKHSRSQPPQDYRIPKKPALGGGDRPRAPN